MKNSTPKKVLSPVEGKNGKTYWLRLGAAFTNRDGSTNVYLDALPTNNRLQIRDFDDEDRNPRPTGEGQGADVASSLS